MNVSATNSNATNANATHAPNMTWAQALNDARALIVQQSARIKSDAQKLRAQQEDVARLQAALNEMSAELQRLRALEPQLADAQAGREHAEALVGRQRVEIDSLETASRELQRMLGEQASRINHMASELHRLRAHIPTDEDAAALESMAALLTTARAGGRGKQRPAHTESVQVMHLTEQSARPLSGPALARQQRDRMHAEAREREQREQEQREQEQREQRELDREQEPSALMDQHEHQVIVIPAEPTPFAQLANRRAA